MNEGHDSINLYVDESSRGNPVYEKLAVEALGDDTYRLLASPGLVLGLAKGDEIRFLPADGSHELLRRGGYLSLQVYVGATGKRNARELISKVQEKLGGSWDGETEKQLVFSVPVKTGFSAVEACFKGFCEENPDTEWYYGNVYDVSDGTTPLNWWLNS